MIYEINWEGAVYDKGDYIFVSPIVIDTKKIMSIRTYIDNTVETDEQVLGLKINGELIPITYTFFINESDEEWERKLEEAGRFIEKIYNEIVEIMKKESE